MENRYHFDDDFVIPRHCRGMKFGWKKFFGIALSALCVAAVFILKLHFLPDFSEISLKAILETMSLDGRIDILKSRIWDRTFFPDMTVSYPGKLTTIIIAVASALLMIVIPKLKFLLQPAIILCNLLISPIAVFSILFIFLPQWFSFDPQNMSDMMTTVSSLIVLGMPILMWLFLAPLPISPMATILSIALFDIILFIIYFLKQLILIFIFRYTNILFIPYLMLLVLTLWDVIWMNATYSIIVSHVSKKADTDKSLWLKK